MSEGQRWIGQDAWTYINNRELGVGGGKRLNLRDDVWSFYLHVAEALHEQISPSESMKKSTYFQERK